MYWRGLSEEPRHRFQPLGAVAEPPGFGLHDTHLPHHLLPQAVFHEEVHLKPEGNVAIPTVQQFAELIVQLA